MITQKRLNAYEWVIESEAKELLQKAKLLSDNKQETFDMLSEIFDEACHKLWKEE